MMILRGNVVPPQGKVREPVHRVHERMVNPPRWLLSSLYDNSTTAVLPATCCDCIGSGRALHPASAQTD
jgi:hypothetical protein